MTDQTETPSATIRRAAAQLKAGAGAATEGPWRAVTGIFAGSQYPAVIKANGDPQDPDTWLLATGNGGGDNEADAAWVASMHPLLGLDLAELLDAAADWWDEGVEWPEVLTVARRFLGETDEDLARADAAAALDDDIEDTS